MSCRGVCELTTAEIVSSFWSKVNKLPDGCWEWHASCNIKGYGQFYNGEKVVTAHRLSVCKFCWCVCHKCDNPCCVRPDHLFLGTSKNNTEDKMRKGRQAKGLELSDVLSRIKIEYNGISKTILRWSKYANMRWATLYGRLRSGWDVKKAIETPVAIHDNVTITYNEKTQLIGLWAKELGFCVETLYSRYYKGFSPEMILNQEVRDTVGKWHKKNYYI